MGDPAQESWRVMRELVLSYDHRKEVSDALGLSFVRLKALLRLLEQPLTLRELAGALGTDPPYTTLIVADLERRGLAERAPHASDRRARIVTITDAGAELARRADDMLAQPPAALLALPREDQDALARILASLGATAG